jgi:hypothetical protein
LFDGFAPAALHGKPAERQAWAVEQVKLAARASANLGLTAHATFSGALAWPYVYPWPQRPAGLVEEAFAKLARRWTPILDEFENAGVDCALNPGRNKNDQALPSNLNPSAWVRLEQLLASFCLCLSKTLAT